MIARLWSAKAARVQSPAYVGHLKTHVLPTLRKMNGYTGAMLLEREESDVIEIIVITFWQSLDSIRSFAGPDLDAAVVADDAARLLTEFDRRIRHYEVVVKDDVA